MIDINKSIEPRFLRSYKCQRYSSYDGLDKNQLRECLLNEQGHLCCYCMSRIDEDNCTIEHWNCRAHFPDQQLDYSNLMACCIGNKGKPPDKQHCGERKGAQCISCNPANREHHVEESIQYLLNGLIYSNNATLNNEINNVLNLNYSQLRDNRKMTLEGALESIKTRGSNLTLGWLNNLLCRYTNKDHEHRLIEYCGIVTFFLKRRIAKWR